MHGRELEESRASVKDVEGYVQRGLGVAHDVDVLCALPGHVQPMTRATTTIVGVCREGHLLAHRISVSTIGCAFLTAQFLLCHFESSRSFSQTPILEQGCGSWALIQRQYL